MWLCFLLCYLLAVSTQGHDEEWVDYTDMEHYDMTLKKMTPSQKLEEHKKILMEQLEKLLDNVQQFGQPQAVQGDIHYYTVVVLSRKKLNEIKDVLRENNFDSRILKSVLENVFHFTNFTEFHRKSVVDCFKVNLWMDINFIFMVLLMLIVIEAVCLWAEMSWFSVLGCMFIYNLIMWHWNWVPCQEAIKNFAEEVIELLPDIFKDFAAYVPCGIFWTAATLYLSFGLVRRVEAFIPRLRQDNLYNVAEERAEDPGYDQIMHPEDYNDQVEQQQPEETTGQRAWDKRKNEGHKLLLSSNNTGHESSKALPDKPTHAEARAPVLPCDKIEKDSGSTTTLPYKASEGQSGHKGCEDQKGHKACEDQQVSQAYDKQSGDQQSSQASEHQKRHECCKEQLGHKQNKDQQVIQSCKDQPGHEQCKDQQGSQSCKDQQRIEHSENRQRSHVGEDQAGPKYCEDQPKHKYCEEQQRHDASVDQSWNFVNQPQFELESNRPSVNAYIIDNYLYGDDNVSLESSSIEILERVTTEPVDPEPENLGAL